MAEEEVPVLATTVLAQKHWLNNRTRNKIPQKESRFHLRSCSTATEHKTKISLTEKGKKSNFTLMSPSPPASTTQQ